VKDQYSVLICVGVVMTILFHVIENIGANIGLLPLTGIPLPFISQGGSALLSNMLAIGLVLALRFDSRRPFEIMSQMI
jgi:rod shape determining protein RodA